MESGFGGLAVLGDREVISVATFHHALAMVLLISFPCQVGAIVFTGASMRRHAR